MVRVVGWTPTSRGEDPAEVSLSKFAVPFEASAENCQDYPYVRSGHRCFTDNDFFYVLGGYTTELHQGAIYKELWALSLASFEWRRYEVDGELPETLASFAIVQTSPFSKSLLCFGGSGTIFGETSSNSLYLLRVNNDDCVVSCRKLITTGTIPNPIYGQAMCAGEVPGKYYVIGGTEGVVFTFDVHALTMEVNPETNEETWNFELITSHTEHAGRYRLEVNYDEKRNCLLFFGGGNAEEVFGFEQILGLDVNTRETREIECLPDPNHGYPVARRCHTLVCYKRNVVISGGIGTPQSPLEEPLLSDVWVLNLDSFSWKKYEHELPERVFFHDSVVTEDGWMLSFGGAHSSLPSAPRNNRLVSAWLDVSPLRRFAIESLRRTFPNMFSGLFCGNLRPSRAVEIATIFLETSKIEEEEKQIIEKRNIKFRETPDRNRYFLNDDDPRRFAVRHQDRGRRVRMRRENDVAEQEAEEDEGLLGGIMAQLNVPAVIRRARDMFRRQLQNADPNDPDAVPENIELVVEVDDPRDPAARQLGEDGALLPAQQAELQNLQNRIGEILQRLVEQDHLLNEDEMLEANEE